MSELRTQLQLDVTYKGLYTSMRSHVRFQRCLVEENLVTAGHMACVTFPWLLAIFGPVHLQRVSTEW
jgi:hypothetical protein